MTRKLLIFSLAVFAGLLGMASAPAIAAPADTPDVGAASDQVSAAQLHDFAAAYGKVSAIRKQLLIKTHAMDDEQKIDALQKKAEDKMKSAILAHMTLGEYVRIGKAINANPALHKRFMKIRASKPPAPASG